MALKSWTARGVQIRLDRKAFSTKHTGKDLIWQWVSKQILTHSEFTHDGIQNSSILNEDTFICDNVNLASPIIIWLNISRITQAIDGGMSTIMTPSVARDVFEPKERYKY